MGLAIGVDVGGTKVAAAVVDERGRIRARDRRPTPARDPLALRDVIAEAITAVLPACGVDGIGIAAAGFVDSGRSTVLLAPNLAWRDEPLQAEIERRVGHPVVVENDANAAAWGEYRFGSGAGADSTVCITVGTGIGGGVILGGALYRGAGGLAGEPGHMQVVPGGRVCGCGNQGCWEQYSSGNALLRHAREQATLDPAGAAGLLALGDGTPRGITGGHVTAAAQAGDPVARAAFGELGRWLAVGLVTIASAIDLPLLLLGGGVADAGALLLDPTVAAFEEQWTRRHSTPVPQIRLADLGNDAGLLGAADLART